MRLENEPSALVGRVVLCMSEKAICSEAATFLNSVLSQAGFSLRAEQAEQGEGCTLEIRGADEALLVADGADLLFALQHIVSQVFSRRGDEAAPIVLDSRNYRTTRERELKLMARHAAERVRKTGQAFTFGPMLSSERRIIHLELASEGELLTESIGEGSARRLKISRKK